MTAGRSWAAPTAGRSWAALPHLPVVGLAAAYAWWFARLSVAMHDGYATFGFDLGIFDQGVWLLSHGHAPFVTVMGRDLFGDHTSWILLLAVPLYWIHDAPQTLLVAQSVLLAAGALPLYALARRLLGDTLLATALAAAYLCNPALQQGDLEQFHPEAFLVPAAALAVWAAVTGRRRVLWPAVAACLLVKEDTAALVVPLGVWMAWRRNRRVGAAVAVVGATYALVAYRVVITTLLGTAGFYANRIPFGGLRGLAGTATRHPGRLLAYLGSDTRPWYLWQLACSSGWAWVISPEVAAIGAGTLAENLISDSGYMHRIDYHYTLGAVPVLAAGTVWAVSRLATPARRATATAVVVVAAVTSGTLWGLAPWSRNAYAHLDPHGATAAAITGVGATLPPDAVVSAWYSYVPHVDHRLRCYQWPTPFRAAYWGRTDVEGTRLPFAGQVQYLYLPTRMDAADAALLSSIRPDFRAVRRNRSATLWRRV